MKVFQITFLPSDGTADNGFDPNHADILLTKKGGNVKLYPLAQFPQNKKQEKDPITS
jgi:hypothetical protein